MKILVFGDVVGRPGRAAVTKALPELRAEYEPDAVIVNIENMAHGAGLSPETMQEALTWQVQAYTTGDHAWDNKLGIPLLEDPKLPLVRPANYPAGVPGRGYTTFQVGAFRVAVMNLQGQVFFKNDPNNPFHALDQLLQQPEVAACQIKLLDFHVEASSEARAMAWHADGRITAQWGTHTHVPTADAQTMPGGLGYITDVGMNGNHHSIIGGDRTILRGFLTQMKTKMTLEDTGPLEVGALFLEVDPSAGITTRIEHVRRILEG